MELCQISRSGLNGCCFFLQVSGQYNIIYIGPCLHYRSLIDRRGKITCELPFFHHACIYPAVLLNGGPNDMRGWWRANYLSWQGIYFIIFSSMTTHNILDIMYSSTHACSQRQLAVRRNLFYSLDWTFVLCWIFFSCRTVGYTKIQKQHTIIM